MNPIKAELFKLHQVSKNARDVDAAVLDIYVEDLADLPTEQVAQAIRELRKSVVFFPAIGEIRNRVVQIIAGAILVDPEACWAEVLREIKRVGTAGTVTYFMDGEMRTITRQFSSPMIERAVQQIGWAEICGAQVENMGTIRAQFREAIKAIQRREIDAIVSGRATDGATLTRLTGPALDEPHLTALPRKAAS